MRNLVTKCTEGSKFYVLKLEDLDIGSGGIYAVKALGAVLQEKDKEITLQRLSLRGNKLTDRHIEILSATISSCRNLKKLSLRRNTFGAQGVTALCKSFEHLRKLRGLYLSENKLGNKGLFVLCRTISRMNNFKSLNLNKNCFGDMGCLALCCFLPRSLKRLFVQKNLYTPSAARALEIWGCLNKCNVHHDNKEENSIFRKQIEHVEKGKLEVKLWRLLRDMWLSMTVDDEGKSKDLASVGDYLFQTSKDGLMLGNRNGEWEECEILDLNRDQTVVIRWISDNIISWKQKQDHLRVIHNIFHINQQVLARYNCLDWQAATICNYNGDHTYDIVWGFDKMRECQVHESLLMPTIWNLDFVVRVKEARNLSKSVDSYVLFNTGHSIFKTKTVHGANPQWQESFEFTYEFGFLNEFNFIVYESNGNEIGRFHGDWVNCIKDFIEADLQQGQQGKAKVQIQNRGQNCGSLYFEHHICWAKSGGSRKMLAKMREDDVIEALGYIGRKYDYIIKENMLNGNAIKNFAVSMLERYGLEKEEETRFLAQVKDLTNDGINQATEERKSAQVPSAEAKTKQENNAKEEEDESQVPPKQREKTPESIKTSQPATNQAEFVAIKEDEDENYVAERLKQDSDKTKISEVEDQREYPQYTVEVPLRKIVAEDRDMEKERQEIEKLKLELISVKSESKLYKSKYEEYQKENTKLKVGLKMSKDKISQLNQRQEREISDLKRETLESRQMCTNLKVLLEQSKGKAKNFEEKLFKTSQTTEHLIKTVELLEQESFSWKTKYEESQQGFGDRSKADSVQEKIVQYRKKCENYEAQLKKHKDRSKEQTKEILHLKEENEGFRTQLRYEEIINEQISTVVKSQEREYYEITQELSYWMKKCEKIGKKNSRRLEKVKKNRSLSKDRREKRKTGERNFEAFKEDCKRWHKRYNNLSAEMRKVEESKEEGSGKGVYATDIVKRTNTDSLVLPPAQSDVGNGFCLDAASGSGCTHDHGRLCDSHRDHTKERLSHPLRFSIMANQPRSRSEEYECLNSDCEMTFNHQVRTPNHGNVLDNMKLQIDWYL